MSLPAPSRPLDVASLAGSRSDLASGDPRRRLAAISALSQLIDHGKANQHAVGAWLRDATRGDRLLDVVVADLSATDRTLRCVAARLVCQLAYENLVNQEAIIQCPGRGFSVGWLHVFSVPPAFHEMPAHATQRGPSAFLLDMVTSAYSDVYDHVGRYYASGCESFLPLCWQFPPPTATDDGGSHQDVPDPADHILGFYLVPRQTQFPEHDDFYRDELLKSLDTLDLRRLQNVKDAFEKYTNASAEHVDPNDFIAFISEGGAHNATSLRWLLDGPTDVVAPVQEYFGKSWKGVIWNHIFVFASMRLNSIKLAETFGTATLMSVANLFHELAFTSGNCISSATYVWLPVLVAAVQRDPDLPAPFKKLIQTLQRGLPYLSRDDKPWRVLLNVKVDQVVPVSWAVFLAQWRNAMELDNQLKLQQQASSTPVRRTSVCSVNDLRRSVVSQLQSQSVRDLTQVQRNQPKTSRFASQQDLTSSSLPLPVFRERALHAIQMNDDVNEDDQRVEDPGNDSLVHNLALFHRMQRSLKELDELGMKNLKEKRKEKQKILETVEINKQHAQEEEARKRLLVDNKHREIDEIRCELERRRAKASAKAQELRQAKHALATQRKQQRDAEFEEKQQELNQKILERDRIQEENVRRLRRQHQQERQSQPQRYANDATAKPIPPRTPSTASKRPLSARGPRTLASKNTTEKPSPEILRQRALLYGQVVSKIYVAEALSRSPQDTEERVIHQPHQLTRSFSVYQNGSFNVKAPIVKLTAPPPRRPRSPRLRRPKPPPDDTDLPQVDAITEHDDPEIEDDGDVQVSPSRRARKVSGASSPQKWKSEGLPPEHTSDNGCAANACATLVMRNAALAVSERIRIPEIPAPHVEEPAVPPYVIAAQYEALDEQYKRNFRERFNLKCVSHRLSYDVLKQYTKIVRRDMAWRAFHDKCSGSVERVKYMDFAGIAQSLGVALSEKKLLVVARQLDPKKSGYVEWKAFYTWWIMQYSENGVGTPTRPKSSR